MSRFLKFVVLTYALTLPAAFAAESSWLVRLNTQSPAAAEKSVVLGQMKSLHAVVETVSPDQNLFKLTFASPAEAQKALQQLNKSSEVAHIAPDHWYRPTVYYGLREKAGAEAPAPVAAAPFEPLNFFPLLNPGVELPGTATPGADPMFSQDYAMKSIGLDRVSTVHADHSMIAAVIDTGVDYNHEDLKGAMWRDPQNPMVVGQDFVHANTTPYDVVHFDIAGCEANFQECVFGGKQEHYLGNPGHGTHCAGHVAAVADNSLGIRGVGAGAQVMALKFFYDAGEANEGQGDDAAAIKAIDYAIAHGVKVISASWGGAMTPAEAEASELKTALIRAQQAGVLFVVAAGNGDSMGNAENQDTVAKPGYPAKYNLDNIIAVAATDQNDAITSFSNYGTQSVHVGAPGKKVLSTVVGSKYGDSMGTIHLLGQSQELTWDGTSMATPIVAGAVALVWSQHPTENYHQIRDRILTTARQVPSLAGKVSSGGIVDVAAAMR